MKGPLVDHVLNQLVNLGKTANQNSGSTALRGWVGPLELPAMAPLARAAYGALEEAVQVAFSRFREHLSQHLDDPVITSINGAIQLTNVEAHVLPAGNHSYELAYASRNPLGFSGYYVVQAEEDGASGC